MVLAPVVPQSELEAMVRLDLARELHDRVAQSLTSMLIGLEFFRREQYGRQSVLDAISELEKSTAGVLNELRDLLYGLRGTDAFDANLINEIHSLLDAFSTRSGVSHELRVSGDWPAILARSDAVQVTRIIQEAAHNAWVHGNAKNLVIACACDDDSWRIVTIEDDGAGIKAAASAPAGGLGVLGMKERALLLGGRLTIEPALGQGTVVRLTFPPRQ